MRFASSYPGIPYPLLTEEAFLRSQGNLRGVFEASRTAIRSIYALQGQIAASLAGLVAVALYLSSFAFITFEQVSQNVYGQMASNIPCNGNVTIPLRAVVTSTAIFSFSFACLTLNDRCSVAIIAIMNGPIHHRYCV